MISSLNGSFNSYSIELERLIAKREPHAAFLLWRRTGDTGADGASEELSHIRRTLQRSISPLKQWQQQLWTCRQLELVLDSHRVAHRSGMACVSGQGGKRARLRGVGMARVASARHWGHSGQ